MLSKCYFGPVDVRAGHPHGNSWRQREGRAWNTGGRAGVGKPVWSCNGRSGSAHRGNKPSDICSDRTFTVLYTHRHHLGHGDGGGTKLTGKSWSVRKKENPVSAVPLRQRKERESRKNQWEEEKVSDTSWPRAVFSDPLDGCEAIRL